MYYSESVSALLDLFPVRVCPLDGEPVKNSLRIIAIGESVALETPDVLVVVHVGRGLVRSGVRKLLFLIVPGLLEGSIQEPGIAFVIASELLHSCSSEKNLERA